MQRLDQIKDKVLLSGQCITSYLLQLPLRIACTSSHELPFQNDGLPRGILRQSHVDDRSESRFHARLAQHHLQGRHEQPRPEPGEAPQRDGHGLGWSGGARPHMVDFVRNINLAYVNRSHFFFNFFSTSVNYLLKK